MTAVEFYGVVPSAIGGAKFNETEAGALDSISQEYLVGFPSWRTSLGTLGIVKNSAMPGFSRMFVIEIGVDQEDGARGVAVVKAVGILAVTGDKRNREVSSQGRIIALGPKEGLIFNTPSGSNEQVNINEPTLNVTDTYFTTTKPQENVQGTAMTPPSAPAAPVFTWSNMPSDIVRLNHPQGWVLDQRTSTEIVPGSLWSVRDFFSYYQPLALG